MVTEVIMPKLGETMEEGVIERWVKKEGERVEKGDILLEVTTDKATLEVESYGSGILRKILSPEGETVPVAQVIALIAEKGEPLPEVSGKPKEFDTRENKVFEEKAGETEETDSMDYQLSSRARIKASPLAKKLAREKGIDLAQVPGTGPGGRITKEDVLKVKSLKLKVKSEKIVPLSPMRKAIAESMAEAKKTIPHYYLTVEVDMTEAVSRRKKLLPEVEKKTGVKLSFNHLLIRAVALALKEYPGVTSVWDKEGIAIREEINIGIAVGLEEGLIVPVLREADKKSLVELASEVENVVSRARAKKLKAEEYFGANFTISNLGMFGIENFLPIINQYQSAILGVGAILKKPAVVEDRVEIRLLMKLTLSVDHRVVDGAVAARFLQKLKEILETGEW
ncbi:MAG: 2-oxo acid dehydrogenase subunit E2 [Nitrospirae bacterium]|nr:2-oxo acid dehydrogenase subunit E2 [Nitrospirota bacterium]